MGYKNSYKYIISKIKLPIKLDDNYVENRIKKQNAKDAYTIEYGWGLCGKKVSKHDLSNLSIDSFKKLSFDERTSFSKEQQDRFNPKVLLEKGKNFGLGLDKLHQIGLNGNCINIAIIDWTYDYNNPEMIDSENGSKILLYDDSKVDKKFRDDDGFHGKTVSSLLVGNNVGVSPKSKLFYFATNQLREDTEISDILEKIKKLNEQGSNIQLVSMSSSFNDDRLNELHTKDLQQQNCAFISSTNFGQQGFNYMCRDNYKDIDDSNNFELENSAERDFSEERFDKVLEAVRNQFDERGKQIEDLYIELENSDENNNGDLLEKIRLLTEEQDKIKPYLHMNHQEFIDTRKKSEQKSIYIPCGGRTYPQIGNDSSYMYCGHASASWTIPQVAGLFAISKQIDPNLSFEEFSEISKTTATKNDKGYLVINPECLVRDINTRNEIKSKSDNEYRKIYSVSQEYISKLDKLKEVSFSNSLKGMVNTDNDISSNTSTFNKEQDIIR